MKKFFTLLSLGLLASLPAHADITIGLAGPMTGSYAVLGEQMRHGAQQAVADINAAGGINNQKIILQEGDDACDPKQAVAVANRMISSNIKFVLGHACSGSSIPASKVYAEENTLMITPVSSNPELTETGLTNVFRTCGRNDQEGEAQANYVLKHLRDKNVGIVHDNTAVQRDMAEQFKKYLNAGGKKEIFFDTFRPGEKDYSSLIAKLKQNNVQVLVLDGYHVEAGLITRQIKQQGAVIQVIGNDSWATQEFWSITGAAGEGALISFEPDATKRAETKPIIEKIHKAGREPESYEFYSYAAIQVLAEGIKRAGMDPVKVAAALRQPPAYITVLGPMSFNAKGDPIDSKFVMYRWHDGKYAEIVE